jgi:diacylglycerol O-acyltransferase / wax synthase
MERLSALDATFLYFETPPQHQHVSAVMVIDPSTVPGGYSFEKLKNFIGTRLDLVKPFRRRLATVPFNLDHPVWVEDGDFDLDYHVRRIGCPSPGTEEQLAQLAADIAGRQLDRARPLWEMWMVEGLENGHIAVVAKMHHCTVDGVSGANLMVHLLDLSPDTRREAPIDEWIPERGPSDAYLLGRAVLTRLVRPVELAMIIPKTIGSAISFVRSRRGHGGAGMPAPFTAPRTPFNVSITPHRTVAMARIPLEEVKKVKKTFGTTVNDVVLAVAAGALRRYLEQIGEMPEKSLIAICPVSVRTDEEEEAGSNKVSAMFTSLATDVDDPVERLRRIHEHNKGAKAELNAIGAGMLQDWAKFAAPTMFSLAARLYSSMKLAEKHPVVHNLVISNVPGPPFPLYFGGGKLVALYPLGPVFHGAALNVTVLSYQDLLYWGFISCRETAPRLWDLAAAVPDALAELVKAADTVTPT